MSITIWTSFSWSGLVGLHMQNAAGVADLSIDGKTPAEQLAEIRKSATALYKDSQDCWQKKLQPALEKAGIQVLNYDQLDPKTKRISR